MVMLTADEIRELRFKLRMTPKQFADALGASESAVRRWENDERRPRIEFVFKLNDLKELADKPPRRRKHLVSA
jgi:transcriptional regulator with XRE-family HTH domain